MGDGSKGAFIALLIAGILSLLVGLCFISLVGFDVFKVLSGNTEFGDKPKLILYLFIGLIEGVSGIWLVSFGFWIKKREQVGVVGLGSLVVGVLSLNVIAIVAGIYVLVKKKEILSGKLEAKRHENFKEDIKKGVGN